MAGNGTTEWAVVLEFATDEPPEITLAQVERLVQALSEHRASALHNPDRYAVQLILRATAPLFALEAALAVHADVAQSLDLPLWALVRAEVMTVPELAQSWGRHAPVPGTAEGKPSGRSGTRGERIRKFERFLFRGGAADPEE